MAEELLEFENTVEDEEGRSHIAVVLGEERDDGQWVGRIRFTPGDGGPTLETERETTQPNRKDLVYWSTGLTYFYLEGALARARKLRARQAASAPTAGERGSDPATAPTSHAAPGVPRLEVISRDAGVVEAVLEARDPRPGTVREVPDAGIIVYEGPGEGSGSHLFSVQFGSPNAGAILSNWLWSRLHGIGAEVRVDGRPVEITNDALHRALVG